MKERTLSIGRVLVLAVLAITALTTSSNAQQALPYDRSAIFKTHVPHINSRIDRGGTAVSGTAQAINPATFSGSAYTVGGAVAATTTFPAAEEHIAVDPANSSHLVAAISDFSQRFGFNTTKYAFSPDNGATWTETFVPFDPNSLALTTSDGESWDANSDPVVAIDKLGNVYLAQLYFDALVISNGFYVSVGTLSPAGVSFSATLPVATNPTLSPNFTEDKPWIAVDNSNHAATTGSVYASWTRFVGSSLVGFSSDMIVFSRSLNHGLTWTSPIQISLPAQNGAVQGSQVAVGPNGEVYVAYEVFFVGGKRQHFLAKSTDGGQTFTAPVGITPVFNDLRFNSTYRKNSFASLAVNPVTGFVYVVYADQSRKGTGAEVEFIRSKTAGGTSFIAPVVINDNSTGQQLFPAVTVDSSGRIHASWFDTRNSPSTSSLYDVYAAFSPDNGLSFSPNARVTATLVDAGSASFIGDYAGIAADGGFAHPVWTSGGFNNGLLQTAKLQLP